MITDKDDFVVRANLFIKEFASKKSEFLMEEVRNFSLAKGFPDASNPAWWGAAAMYAKKHGVIEATGKRELKKRIPGVSGGTGYGMVWRSKVCSA